MRLPEYRRWLAALSTPREEVGEPIDRFLVLPNPQPQPAAADESLAFTVQPGNTRALPRRRLGGRRVRSAPTGGPVVAALDGQHRVISPADSAWTPTRTSGAPASAHRTRGRPRQRARGRSELRLQDRSGHLGRARPHAAASAGRRHVRRRHRRCQAAGRGALRRGRPGSGRPISTPTAISTSSRRSRTVRRACCATTATARLPCRSRSRGATRVRGFVWADLDGDGVPDAALLDAAGVTRVYLNARGGSFREQARCRARSRRRWRSRPPRSRGDSVMDVLALASTGAIMSLSQAPDGTAWTAREVARVRRRSQAASRPGLAGLLVADLDNNGAADLVVATPSSSHVLLRGPATAPRPLARAGADGRARGRRSRRRRTRRSGWRAAGRPRRDGQEPRRDAVSLADAATRTRRPSPAISVSTRSASAVKWKCGRGCTCRSA